MPIPPRPIPSRTANANPSARHSRPGSSVPRKSALSAGPDWRAEIALLPHAPSSLPSAHGIKFTTALAKSLPGGQAQQVSAPGGREVDLAGLVVDGRGKREKRTTTATTLGFDFVPIPQVLALPDTDTPASSSAKRPTPRPSTGSASALTASAHSHAVCAGGSRVKTHASPPRSLSATPTTPALLPVLPARARAMAARDADRAGADADADVDAARDHDGEGEGEGEADEEDDWERIEDLQDDDGDMIVLGELELDDVEIPSKPKVRAGVGKTARQDRPDGMDGNGEGNGEGEGEMVRKGEVEIRRGVSYAKALAIGA